MHPILKGAIAVLVLISVAGAGFWAVRTGGSPVLGPAAEAGRNGVRPALAESDVQRDSALALPIRKGKVREGVSSVRPKTASAQIEVLRDFERRLLPGDALDAEVVKEMLGAKSFDRIVGAVARAYAADADTYRIKLLYTAQMKQELAGRAVDLRTFECGLGYCLGEIQGDLAPGDEDQLGVGVDTGAFALLPLASEHGKSYRFVFSTDPSVKQIQGVFAGG